MKIQKTFGISAPLSALTAALLSSSAVAGIKYWDNPKYKAYDVGDYAAQESLVLNYDGIRNVGAAADHDPNATTWKNLGTGGSNYDMVQKGSPTSASCWSENGFFFEGKTWFVTPNKVSLPNAYEMEALVNAAYSKQTSIGYILFVSTAYPRTDDGGWAWGSIAIRQNGSPFNQTIGGTAYAGKACFNTTSAGSAYRPAMLDDSYGYLTALANRTYVSFFTGVEEPTGVPGRIGLASGKTALGTTSLYFYLGGHNTNGGGETSVGEPLIGTIRNFRFYSTPLSYEQRAWNRVVDNARYFGATSAALPVTNAVVTANYEYASGDTPNGTYAVDSDGYTFTAPATKGFQGRAFTLTGYTVERWNAAGGTWGAAEQHAATADGASVTVSASDCVRITWLWDAPASARTYSLSDYVTDGLLLFYDGICNQGADKPHDSTATTWVNIGNGDGSQDCTLSLNRKRSTAGDAGAWSADGYNFKGYSEFKKEFSLMHPTTHSIQMLVDADKNDQIYTLSYAYATAYDYSSFILSKTGTPPVANSLCWCAGGSGAPNRPYVQHADGKYSYATAIMDGTARTQAFTEGTTIPSSGSLANGFYQSGSDFPDFTAARIFLGGYNGGDKADNACLLVGKVKFFRYYPNKKLTEAELAQNRKVDDYRYFGKLPPITTTNVVVQSTYSYLQGNEPDGAYETGSSHTFAAPATVTAPNGIEYACDGYIIETQDGIGWANATHYTGNSYLYNTSAGTVRLTWKWKATRGIRSAADYGFDDLSPAGLALHYDGLLNAGVGVTRSTSATKWVNLGSRPGMNLSRATAGSDTSKHGVWGEKGYAFGGYGQFNSASGLSWPTTFSAQLLADAKHADNTNANGNYIAATTWKMFGMQIYGAKKVGRFNVQGTSDINKCPNFATAAGIDYMTVIHDAVTKTAVAFPDTRVPTGGSAADGYMHFDTFNGIENNQFRLGGWGGGPDEQNFIGTLYTFRYYDRVLTEEELVRNRNVDSVRYFGELGVTNVLVEVGGGTQAETGAYKVEGEWTFTAATTVNRRGETVPVERHSIETLENGAWANRQTYKGNSYTYTEGTSPATVRLKWLGRPDGMMLLVR